MRGLRMERGDCVGLRRVGEFIFKRKCVIVRSF